MAQDIPVKRINIDMPTRILNDIDKICKDSYMTRRKWFIDAALERLEKENLNKIDMIVKHKS